MVAAPCGGCERINSELMGKRPLRTHAHGAGRLADNTPRHFINLVQCTEPTKERERDRWKKKVGQNILKFRLDLACSCSCCWICLLFFLLISKYGQPEVCFNLPLFYEARALRHSNHRIVLPTEAKL